MTPELAEAYATIERLRGLADDFAREAREANADARTMRARIIADLELSKASLSIYEQSYGPKEKRARARAFDCAIHILKHGLGVEGDS
jgi:hypothetical protein